MQNASVLYSLTCKYAWRHSGVPFFDHFSTSARQKMARTPHALNILTCKYASRYSGVQIFHSPTSKNAPTVRCFVHFDLQMCFAPQRRAIFDIWTSKSAQEWMFLSIFTWNVLRATAACNFSCLLYAATSAPAALASLLFDPADTQIIEKTQPFVTFLTFRATGSSLYWLSRSCIFFLLILLLVSAFSSADSTSLLCFFNCPYCRKLDF